MNAVANPLGYSDSYKLSHIRLEIPGINMIYSNLTPRNTHYMESIYPDFDGKKYECSENKVTSINKILGKVVVYDNGEKILYPLNFYLKYDGKTIIEWGNND